MTDRDAPAWKLLEHGANKPAPVAFTPDQCRAALEWANDLTDRANGTALENHRLAAELAGVRGG